MAIVREFRVMGHENGPLQAGRIETARGSGSRLRRELILGLTIKFCALTLLWWLFSSDAPAPRNMAGQVAAVILGARGGQ
ncbi:MAG: cytochrome oxidase putative small subunit CydP [Gammaproteobacteria bacterium]